MTLVHTKVEIKYGDAGVRMERIPREVYKKQLREEAVRLVTQGELSIPEVGRGLSISASTIRYWVKASREAKLQELGRRRRPLTGVEMELARVKRELVQVKMWSETYKKKRPRTLRRTFTWRAQYAQERSCPSSSLWDKKGGHPGDHCVHRDLL